MENKNTFGEFLKQKRVEKNLTQKELSKLLFVSESAVSKWEKDVAHPDITLLPKLSEILGVSEHELITASVDNKSREEKLQAKKWRAFSMSWSLFFYISYAVALIPCFICNLAIDKTLSWFWVVLSALLLSFAFTNMPKLIKKYKLILIPLSQYLALCLLLGVCCIYTKGNWFLVSVISVLLGLVIIFAPIYISKLKCFEKIRKYNDYISIGVDFVVLNILLVICDIYSVSQGYIGHHWYFKIGLPIALIVYAILNILISVKFLKVNRLLKTSIILALVNLFLYLPPTFIKVENVSVQREIEDLNIFKADFSRWTVNNIDNNVNLIISLSLAALALAFFVFGMLVYFNKKNKGNNK